MTKYISEPASDVKAARGLRVTDWETITRGFLETWREVRPLYVGWRLMRLLEEYLAADEVDIAELVERIIDITGGVKWKT